MKMEFLETKLAEVKGHLLYIENDNKEWKARERYNREVWIEKAVKTTLQTLYDKGLFDNYDNVDEVLKKYLTTES